MNGLAVMVWTWPWLLAGAAAVAGPWLAHRMRRRPVARRRFAALSLLRQAMTEDHDRDLIRRRWLLALRACAVLLLVFAFARPVWLSPGAVAPGQGVDRVFVLDASASMGTVSEGVSLFRRAQDQAIAELQRLNPATDRVAVVFAGPIAETGFSQPVHDFAQVRQRIEQAVPTEAQADLSGALALGKRLLQRGEVGRSSGMVVWTDGQLSNWKQVDPAFLSAADFSLSLSVRTLDAGVVVQRSVHDLTVMPAQPVMHRPVRVAANVIQHAPTASKRVTARLRLDQRVVAQSQVELDELGIGQAVFDVRFSSAGERRVSVELDADALAVDDRVQRVITVRERPVVGLVGSGAEVDPWSAALVPRIDAPGAPQLYRTAPESMEKALALQPQAMLIPPMDRVDPKVSQALGRYVQQGGVVMLVGAAGVDPTGGQVAWGPVEHHDAGRQLGQVRWDVAPLDQFDPVGIARWMSMRWSRRLRLSASDATQVLMQDQDGVPRVMIVRVGDGAIVVLNFEMPPRAEAGVMVSLLHMLLDHVTPAAPRRDFTVGRPAAVSVEREGQWELRDPHHVSWPVTAEGSLLHLPRMRQTGRYVLACDDGSATSVTFNADPAESDLRRTADPMAGHAESSSWSTVSAAHGRDLWPVLIGGAFAVLMIESLLLFWWRR